MENPTKMDDLGVPLCSETSINVNLFESCPPCSLQRIAAAQQLDSGFPLREYILRILSQIPSFAGKDVLELLGDEFVGDDFGMF